MRILLDECVPSKFTSSLSGQGRECSTVPEAGMAGKKTGELLRLAETIFDVLVTLDQGLEYQQNLSGRKIAVIVIRARSNRYADVLPHAKRCLDAIASIQPGQLVRLDLEVQG